MKEEGAEVDDEEEEGGRGRGRTRTKGGSQHCQDIAASDSSQSQ